MKKEVLVLFNFTFAKLKQLCDNMIQLIDRDKIEFEDRGYNEEKKAAFAAQIETFVSIPSDETLDGIKQTTTQDKDAIRKELEIAMRGMISAVQLVFKNFPGKQVEFGEFEITRLKDNELVRNARLMKTAAAKYLGELAAEGINEAKISTLESLNIKFDKAIDVQKKAITDRNSVTERRRIEANKLYEMLMDNSERGKSIFADVSQAKYSDYVIYNTKSGSEDKDENPDNPSV